MRLALHAIVAAMLLAAASSARAVACGDFTDVDSTDTTYCTAVTYIAGKGITLGCDATHYCPNDYVTRLQMALFMQRLGKGGAHNTVIDQTEVIAGGDFNHIQLPQAFYASVGGGFGNSVYAGGLYATIGGGHGNTVDMQASVVAGGEGNTALGTQATIGGGVLNEADGDISTIVGGSSNTAAGDISTVLGGLSNAAAGPLSVVVGHRAKTTAAAKGSFVFADSTEFDVTSGSPNEFIVAASGGIRMLSSKSGTLGCSLPPGGGAWECSSSRDLKRDFVAVDPQQVLARAIALPVMRWRYVTEPDAVQHMGTFSQDFRAAFGLGTDDRSISLMDAEGVALASIQALAAQNAAQARELADVKATLAVLMADRARR